MSRWTVQLRWIVQTMVPDNMAKTLDEKILYIANTNTIFQKYTLFDNQHRTELNQKIINHYLFREIGFETVALWINRLNEKMKLIMPRYNMMYKAYAQDFNIMQSVSTVRSYIIKETGSDTREKSQNTSNNINDTFTGSTTNDSSGSVDTSGTSTAENSGSVNGTNTQDDKHSDYPQSNISSGDYLSTEDYTTGSNSQTSKDNSSGSSTSKTTTSDTVTIDVSNTDKRTDTGSLTGNESGTNEKNVNYTEDISGLNGYPVDALLKYLDFVNNVDELIINELADLFFLIL